MSIVNSFVKTSKFLLFAIVFSLFLVIVFIDRQFILH
ncbi:hypothetical protein ND16A_0428 [Thalassotalea sp. ND16A]|nr:hypothetical protein ND16A_0428 [Thalassotalea sp. ND16A]